MGKPWAEERYGLWEERAIKRSLKGGYWLGQESETLNIKQKWYEKKKQYKGRGEPWARLCGKLRPRKSAGGGRSKQDCVD